MSEALLDPHPADDVAPDVHSEYGLGVGVGLVGVGRQLDPARLTPASYLHLGLHDDGVTDLFGQLHGLVRRDGHPARRNGDAIAGEVLLALVLEQVHWFSLVPQSPPNGGCGPHNTTWGHHDREKPTAPGPPAPSRRRPAENAQPKARQTKTAQPKTSGP